MVTDGIFNGWNLILWHQLDRIEIKLLISNYEKSSSHNSSSNYELFFQHGSRAISQCYLKRTGENLLPLREKAKTFGLWQWQTSRSNDAKWYVRFKLSIWISPQCVRLFVRNTIYLTINFQKCKSSTNWMVSFLSWQVRVMKHLQFHLVVEFAKRKKWCW